MRHRLLVVAGETSGDRMAAAIIRALPLGVGVSGIGGPLAERAGLEPVITTDVSAIGLWDPVSKSREVLRTLICLRRHVVQHHPDAALLINLSGFNEVVGRWLRRRGVPVVWCGAPQVWAWRPGRKHSFHRCVDRMAVLFPFEADLWHQAGVDAQFVGFPSFETATSDGETRDDHALAVLLGSRGSEVQRLAAPLLAAAVQLQNDGCVERIDVLVPPGPPQVVQQTQRACARAGVDRLVFTGSSGAAPYLGRYGLALVASGTATLEAALAGTPTVICYRTDAVTFAVASRVIRTSHIGLPNILLGRDLFPECLQQDCVAERVAAAAKSVLKRRDHVERGSGELRQLLAPPHPDGFGPAVARMLAPWLAPSSSVAPP